MVRLRHERVSRVRHEGGACWFGEFTGLVRLEGGAWWLAKAGLWRLGEA